MFEHVKLLYLTCFHEKKKGVNRPLAVHALGVRGDVNKVEAKRLHNVFEYLQNFNRLIHVAQALELELELAAAGAQGDEGDVRLKH